MDFLSYESTRHKNIHVLGDSIAGAPGMPKSGHMANAGGLSTEPSMAQGVYAISWATNILSDTLG